MTINEAKQQVIQGLDGIYDLRESANIADMILENITGLKKIDRIIAKNKILDDDDIFLLKKYTGELHMNKPVQYVLHEAWFYGLKFYVDEHVLIPRPETEELVRWLIEYIQTGKSTGLQKSHILDIGTGSGCIPIALKKQLLKADIDACDISLDALDIAQKNAVVNDVSVNFFQLDILREPDKHQLKTYDFIISNPPYIPFNDRATMKQNVLAYEPHIALFVDDADPLIFYKAIADFAQKNLSPDGQIFVELHEELAMEAQKLFFSNGFSSIEIKKDMQGKNRMMKIGNGHNHLI